mmetsp:Transcript_17505/g.41034  ORF Transcript_17505/g.41034 Transcript_17505/m.41034 type:complete len:204 (-) Transcript_17505:804-1415(-)
MSFSSSRWPCCAAAERAEASRSPTPRSRSASCCCCAAIWRSQLSRVATTESGTPLSTAAEPRRRRIIAMGAPPNVWLVPSVRLEVLSSSADRSLSPRSSAMTVEPKRPAACTPAPLDRLALRPSGCCHGAAADPPWSASAAPPKLPPPPPPPPPPFERASPPAIASSRAAASARAAAASRRVRSTTYFSSSLAPFAISSCAKA